MSPDRQVDLSLPDSVPLRDLIGQLLDVCTEPKDRSVPVTWTLRPVGGGVLPWASTLESARVHDGAVLELSPLSAGALPTTVEDVRDATEDAVDRRVDAWGARDTRTVALLVLALLALGLMTIPRLWTASFGNGSAVAAAVATALLWSAIRVARQDLALAAHGLLAAGLAWIGALASCVVVPVSVGPVGLTAASRAALCAVMVLAAAAAVARAMPGLVAWVAAATVGLCAALLWSATEFLGRSGDQALAVGTVVGVLSLGILPRMSLAAGGLAGLDYRVRTYGSVEPGTVDATVARSRSLLNGALLATGGLTAVGAVRLSLAGAPIQVGLGIAIACCLLLRARAFSQFLHVLTLTLAGLLALLGQLSVDLFGGDPHLSTFPVVLLVGGCSALLARNRNSVGNDVVGARSRRLLDAAESLAIATLVPLLAGNIGVLDWVREWVN